jgi:hypothetical protein
MVILGRLMKLMKRRGIPIQVLIQKYDIKTGWGESRSRPKINLQKMGNCNR